MILWIIFALTVFAVVLFLLLPLWRDIQEVAPRADYDSMIYRDQLAEVENDVGRGLLNLDQADAVRTEIYKRAMVSEAAEPSDEKHVTSKRSKLVMALVVVIVLPVGALLTYAYLGSPELPGRPFAERHDDPEFVVAREAEKLSEQLKSKPDARGYERLGDMYYALHEYEKTADAYQNSAKIDDKNAKIWSSLGEAMVLGQAGVITPEAKDAFQKSLRLDQHDPRANFYLGLAAFQMDEPKKAVAIWKKLQKESSPDAAWLPMVKEHIDLAVKQSGLNPDTIQPEAPSLTDVPGAETIMSMGSIDQNAMIHKMVDRLAAKLKNNPDDLDGWERLARSYRVLGENEKAEEAEAMIQKLKVKGGIQ